MQEGIKWSMAYQLFNSKDHLEVKGKPGVYRIRAFTEDGEPLTLNRVRGADREGILHIGKSKNLGTRIRMFRQAAEGLKASHHAGCEFHNWQYQNLIPRDRLRFDYFKTSTESEALRLERLLHEQYRSLFLDRPPLDGTSGQSDD